MDCPNYRRTSTTKPNGDKGNSFAWGQDYTEGDLPKDAKLGDYTLHWNNETRAEKAGNQTMLLQQAAFAETIVTLCGRIGGRAPDDHMIEEVDIDRFGRLAELTGEMHVRGAWCRISTGMVVNADYCRGGFADRFTKHFAGMCERRGCRARRHLHATNQPVLAIQAEHPELFDRE